MKTIIITFIIFLFTIVLQSQTKKDIYTTQLKMINVIVFILNDDTILEPARLHNVLNVKSDLFTKGFVLGWKHRKKNDEFKISHFNKGDTLFIETPKYKGSAFGLNFYSEKIKTIIHCPTNKTIIIKKGEKRGFLKISEEFEKLTVVSVL